MNGELITVALDIIFSKYMVYLAPMIFMFMVLLFSDRLIELIQNAVTSKSRWR